MREIKALIAPILVALFIYLSLSFAALSFDLSDLLNSMNARERWFIAFISEVLMGISYVWTRGEY